MVCRRMFFAGVFVAMTFLLPSCAAIAEPEDNCRAINWDEITTSAIQNTPFHMVDRNVLSHRVETRGFVSVPLDYETPKQNKIEIFYRLMPSIADTNPILLVMNGGPGSPSSGYRALDYDYAGSEDTFTELAKHFRILAVDQRGTGNSAPLDLDDPSLSQAIIANFFDSNDHARDHARVIEAVVPEGESFFILARSYGGHIGFQYVLLGEDVQQPVGYIFSSALLPHTNAVETFILRRKKQRDLNLSLKKTHPEVIQKIARLRDHFQSLGVNPDAVNFLWEYLGKGPAWEDALSDVIDRYLRANDKTVIENELAQGIQQTVNLLNYVLSSSSITPNYTDRTLTVETSREVPLESWMLDENWTLNQIGNDGIWREKFICAVDLNPPPPTKFPPLAEIRAALAKTNALFTFGATDAYLPKDLQLNKARQFHVSGHTEFEVLSGGHGAAFSRDGAETVDLWASKIIGEQIVQEQFIELMTRVSEGWSTNNTELALSAFADGAVYSEPPSLQIYKGRDELREFFDAVRPGSSMTWHNLWYNENAGFGAGEYSFHNGGRATAAHGVAVVEINDAKISIWREYQRRGPIDFEKFHDSQHKE